ncbi:MAG: TolC family protein [Bacillota bacterium]
MDTKRVVIFFMIFIFLTAPQLLAEEIELDLKKSISLAEERNNALKTAELSLKKSELDYKKMKAENRLNQHQSAELEAEKSFINAQKYYSSSRAEIIKEIITQYLTLLLNQKEIKAQELTAAAEERLYNEMQRRFELADVNRIDLLEQQTTFRDEEMKLENLKDNYQQNLVDFKNNLKLENSALSLEEIETAQYWDITEKYAVDTALQNNFDLKTAEIDIRLAEISRKIKKIDAPEIDIKIADIILAEAEIKKEDIIDELTRQVKSAYLTLEQKKNRISLEKERLDKTRSEFKQVKREFELGSAARTAVLQYEAEFFRQQYNYQNAILSYCLAAEELADLLNLEPGVMINGEK